jgi:hypothetical protein
MTKKTATLIPYEHFEWGATMRVWVDKDHMHPDPNKMLIWGWNDCGETVPGDFKRSFHKIGEPVQIPYDTSGVHTASDVTKRKLEAIKKYILSLDACKG